MTLTSIDAGMLALAQKYVPANYKRAMKYLEEAKGGLTIKELAATMHLTRFGAEKIVAVLREFKIVRIAAWHRRERGPITAAWGMGPGADARKPAAYTQAQKNRRWRAKVDYSRTRPDRDMSSKLSLVGQLKTIGRST